MTTSAQRYVEANKVAGLAQLSLWVPEHNVDTLMTLAEDMRLNHYKEAIRKGDRQIIETLAKRNRRALPTLPSFEDAFNYVGSCMIGGYCHPEAKNLYDKLASAINDYIDTEAAAKKRLPDAEVMVLNARMYVLATEALSLRNKIELLAHKEAKLQYKG